MYFLQPFCICGSGRQGRRPRLFDLPAYLHSNFVGSLMLPQPRGFRDQRTIIIRRPVVVSPTGFYGDLHSLHSRSKIATTKCSNILSEVRRVLLSVRIDAAYSAIISVPAKLHYFVMNQKRRRGKIYRHRSAFSPFLLLVDFFRWSDDDAADEQCFCIHGWVDTSSSGSLDLGSKIRSC